MTLARGRYGVDAPGLARGFLFVGLGFGLAAFGLLYEAGRIQWVRWLDALIFAVAVYGIFMCFYMLWGSLVAKVHGRDSILDLRHWTGDEQVLDVGCGRGLLLVGAAHRLTTGKAVGIDIWDQKDQSANEKEAALENARLEGVDGRVTVETGDMRRLPFSDASFDVVVSSWAVHNLAPKADRQQALREMVRVLRPSGSILLNDIINRVEYEQEFKSLGLLGVRVVVASKWRDYFAALVSFGSFRPATVLGLAPEATAIGMMTQGGTGAAF